MRKKSEIVEIFKLCCTGLYYCTILVLYNIQHEIQVCCIFSETFNRFSLPTIVIVSLPQSGSEVLRHVFENSSDFLYLPHQDASIPIAGDDPMKYDPCYWFDNSAFAAPAGWFRTTSTEPLLFLNNHPTNPRIEILRRKFRGSGKSARFVLDLSSGFWNTKVSRTRIRFMGLSLHCYNRL